MAGLMGLLDCDYETFTQGKHFFTQKTSLPGPGEMSVTKPLKKVSTTSPYSKVVHVIVEEEKNNK